MLCTLTALDRWSKALENNSICIIRMDNSTSNKKGAGKPFSSKSFRCISRLALRDARRALIFGFFCKTSERYWSSISNGKSHFVLPFPYLQYSSFKKQKANKMGHHKRRTPVKNFCRFCFVLFCHFKYYVFLLFAKENILYARHELCFFNHGLLLRIFTFHKITKGNGKVTSNCLNNLQLLDNCR